MISFKDYLKHEQTLSEEYLEEKLILFNQGKKYGQIVFLAGGAGSGKGFAIKNFIEKEKFKIRDVDEWKTSFLKLSELTDKYPDIKGLDLKNPQDVFRLHKFVAELNIKEKSLANLLKDLKETHLPNIIFDITLKDMTDLVNITNKLVAVGYNPKDIHIVWVLTDYQVAIKANQARDRVVPNDIMFQTHTGAAKSMWNIIHGAYPTNVDGSIYVILNNRENTVYYDEKKTVIKDFTYITVKSPGKSITTDADVKKQLFDWIYKNTPMFLEK